MKILVIIVLTVTIIQLHLIECEHPQYTFRCMENGDIHLFGLHKNSIILSLKGDIGSCTKTDVKNTNSTSNFYYVIPNKCSNSPTTRNKNHSVQIVVEDPTIDKEETTSTQPISKASANSSTTTTTTTTATTSASNQGKRRRRGVTTALSSVTTAVIPTTQFIGGHGNHRFNITCKSIPPTGVNKNVVHVFQGEEYNVLPVNNMEVDDVEMRFKAINDTNTPDINTIYVGDEFFMFLEYKGTKAYSVIPNKCKAYSGTVWGNEGTKQVHLWNQDNPGCIQQKELLQGFIKKSPKLIYAEMFGFRFSDSNYITIQCEVGILPEYTLENLCRHTRKRRQIENVEVKTKFAASKIRVYDNKDMYQMENKSSQKSFDNSVWTVLVFGTLLYRW